MNRGLRPILESIEWDGCPFCGEPSSMIGVNGPDEIVLSCGHRVDGEAMLGGIFTERPTDNG